MCGINAAGLSTGLTVAGTYSQMKAAKQNAAYQAAVAENNAAIADRQAVEVGQQGAYEQYQIRQQGAQTAGAQRAQFAANGLDVQAGSPLAVLSDTAYQTAQDISVSQYNTGMQMWGLQNQAADYRSQASAARVSGRNASRSALLTGLTSLSNRYANWGGN